MPEHDSQGSTRASGHEQDTMQPRTFLPILGAFPAAIVLSCVVLILLLNHFTRQQKRTFAPVSPVASQPQPLPPDPRLQKSPPADLQAMRAAETQTLQTYGWIDRNKGIVRIPIDRAMSLLVERAASNPRAATSSAPGSSP